MAILISVSMVLALLALWIVDRRRVVRQLESVAARQQQLDIALNAFMEESEKIALHLSRLVSAKQSNIAPPPPERKSIHKKHLVLGLAQKGKSVPEIAGRLMIPKGEVELILNLNRKEMLTGAVFPS